MANESPELAGTRLIAKSRLIGCVAGEYASIKCDGLPPRPALRSAFAKLAETKLAETESAKSY